MACDQKGESGKRGGKRGWGNVQHEKKGGTKGELGIATSVGRGLGRKKGVKSG